MEKFGFHSKPVNVFVLHFCFFDGLFDLVLFVTWFVLNCYFVVLFWFGSVCWLVLIVSCGLVFPAEFVCCFGGDNC